MPQVDSAAYPLLLFHTLNGYFIGYILFSYFYFMPFLINCQLANKFFFKAYFIKYKRYVNFFLVTKF